MNGDLLIFFCKRLGQRRLVQFGGASGEVPSRRGKARLLTVGRHDDLGAVAGSFKGDVWHGDLNAAAGYFKDDVWHGKFGKCLY